MNTLAFTFSNAWISLASLFSKAVGYLFHIECILKVNPFPSEQEVVVENWSFLFAYSAITDSNLCKFHASFKCRQIYFHCCSSLLITGTCYQSPADDRNGAHLDAATDATAKEVVESVEKAVAEDGKNDDDDDEDSYLDLR